MEKRVWTKPVAAIEGFMPNEYIAACWDIKCDVDGNDGFGMDYGGHRDVDGTCGSYGAMYVRDLGNNKYEIVEDHYNWGMLDCEIVDYIDYENKTVEGSRGVYSVEIPKNTPSKTLYWITKSGQYEYYHYGTVSFDKTVQAS